MRRSWLCFLLPLALRSAPAPVPATASDLPLFRAADLAWPAEPPPLPALPEQPDPDGPIAIGLSPDGVFDIAAALQAEASASAAANPFLPRWRTPAPARTETLSISSVLIGGLESEASAVIDGRVCSPGDSVAGLILESVASDHLELQRGRIRLSVPVREQAVPIRLPAQ